MAARPGINAYMIRRYLLLYSIVTSALAAAYPAAAQQEEQPDERPNQSASDDGLTLSGEYRLRAEGLNNRFRANASGDTSILVQRTIIAAHYRSGDFVIGAEVMDSRALLADSRVPIGNDDVNPLDLLQGYIGYRGDNALEDGDRLALTAGRMTMNIGARRLISRNNFRNTINAFTGARAIWDRANGDRAELFYVLPVDRRPTDIQRLFDNNLVLDQESGDRRFYGGRYVTDIGVTGPGDKASVLELYAYRLDENDSQERQTGDRAFWTVGGRLHRSPDAGRVDFDVQGAYQFGRSSLSSAANVPRLDHSAGFIQTVIGYTLSDGWQTRIAVSYDFASGDKDPLDGINNRFDSLFGSRGQDFGQTGIYGLLARTNLSSPGAVVTTNPSSRLELMARYRPPSLASSRDVFVTTGVVDETGQSGRFIGHEIIGRAIWQPFHKNIHFEIGGAWLGKGRFLEQAPNAAAPGNVVYGYGSVQWVF